MKVRILVALAFSLMPLSAFDWEAVWTRPAGIEVINMEPVPLVASGDPKGWARVPLHFTTYRALIYTPTSATNGIADIRVTRDGYLMLACNYDYQGNASGDWQKDVWDEARFLEKGWRKMEHGTLGGSLVKGDNREQILFVKQVREGDQLRIRCNKADPPFPILVSEPVAAAVR